MGRLIDADNISFYCNYKGDCTGNINDCKKCENYICNFRDIQEQPTAYDVRKVVAKIKELDNPYDADGWFTSMKLDKAIEIVKHGVISDDVCEWKYNDTEYYWESSCDHLHIFMSDGPKENEYEFCPYCGKKIKVIGGGVNDD